MTFKGTAVLAAGVFLLGGCEMFEGPPGPEGPAGPAGERGEKGPPGASGEADTASGTRLRRLYRLSSDGGRMLVATFDEEVGVECAWAVATDGTERCMPAESRSAPIGVLYTDDACSTAIAVIRQPACGTLPAAITYRLPGECHARARRMSFNVEEPAALYQLVADASGEPVCVATPKADYLYYALEPELPPDAWVSGTTEIE